MNMLLGAESVITSDTGIGLGLIVTVLTIGTPMLVMAVLLRRDVAEMKKNGYTTAQASEHALRLAIANPTMRVPDPRDPRVLICVHDEAVTRS